ncbi:NTP transferase domain-containing protein [Sphingomonas sp. ASV193]|uniref:NTP transferase domain-containing protein n=1 Tax=Sphingomonas sp. ASV193 TaxID=3144405 RepID=UPI0032E8A123
MSWTALLLAGSRPGGDPFAEAQGVRVKALIPIGGAPMIARPLRALADSPMIERVVVLTQDPAELGDALPRSTAVERSSGTIASTLGTRLSAPDARFPVLVTTADHALLTPAIVADFTARAAGADLAIGVVSRAALDRAMPETRRTWLRFRGEALTGANLFAFATPAGLRAVELWRSVEQDRKKGWRLLWQLGPDVLLGALLRRRTGKQTADAIGRRLGLSIRLVELADPLAAIDVDKPSDLALVRRLVAEGPR